MTTTIGPNTRIDGRLEGDDELVIEGRIDGTIAVDADVTIAASGFVTGDVHAPVVTIEGALSGTVRGDELVRLAEGAQVEAEIFAQALRIDPGANLKGRIEMDVEAAPPLPEPTERAERTESTSTPSSARTSSTTSSATTAPAAASRAAAGSSNGRGGSATATVTVVEGDPDELTVKELRELLKEHDLPVSGTKSELIDRLRTVE
jgi:cytoskeletal protein CcmA (bactofilin family)